MKYDIEAIRKHIQQVHYAAGRANVLGGKLCLAVYGEDPDTKERLARVQHFDIGDIDGMTNAAMTFEGVSHANIYAPFVVFKPDVEQGTRKGEDIVSVFALVNDADADKGAAAPSLPVGVSADYTIESSAGNLQEVLWLDRPLSPNEAKDFGNALKRATGADAANDIGHVWRIPGGLNWPNAKKVHERCRSREPQRVRVAAPWSKWTIVDKLRTALSSHWEEPPVERSAAAGANTNAPKFNYEEVAWWIDKKLAGEWAADSTALSQEDWALFGKALKVSFPGDDGLDLWLRMSHDQRTAERRWNDPGDFKPNYVERMRTLKWYFDRDATWMWRHVDDCPRQPSPPLMPLPVGAPLPDGWHWTDDGKTERLATTAPAGSALLGNTAAVVADLGRSTVEAFIAAQSGNRALDAPALPATANAHPLFDLLNVAIAHVVGNAEGAPKAFRASAAVEVLAVLSATHQQVFDTVCARIRSAGAALPEGRLSAAVRRFESQVAREIRTGAGWATDTKGMPDGQNTDNVAVFTRIIGAELRFNAWSKRPEIRWSADGEWAPLQDKDFSHLLTTAGNGQHNFHPRDSMFKRALSALAYEATFDPVLDRIAAAQSAWDGVPRLDSWLSRAVGAPDDAYHRAVGRNLLGGLVKRARRPGCKHDEVVILIGPEDTLKSTLCRALAMEDEWFTDSVDFSGSPQNTIPQLFGRTVVELAELDGMARREVQFIKRFLSAQTDNVTLKYEAFTSDHARRCIFVGTSNETNPLRGDSGNRRFLPVKVERRIDIEYVRAHLDQIIGEAAVLETAGELFLIPRDVVPDARARQEAARTESDFEIHLNAWFLGKSGAMYILPADLATLLKDAVGRSIPPNQSGTAMRRLGFESIKPRGVADSDKQTRIWCRGNVEHAQRITVRQNVTDRRWSPVFPMVSPVAPLGPPPGGSAVVLPMVRAQS